MQKIYLLLRNNKQSGPYSLSELIALQLRPLDLVWVEGRSRSWQYPTEMSELKGHVKESKNKNESITVYPQASTDLVLPKTNKKSSDDKAEDKINVQVYVKLPHESEAERFFSEHNPLLPSDGTGAPVQSKGPVVQPADGLLNTKYTRDLQEIKAEYTAWIGQRKQTEQNRQQNKPWLIWAIIAFLGMAGFLSERWSSGGSASNQNLNTDSTQVRKLSPLPASKSSKTKKNTRATEKNEKSKKATDAATSADKKKEQKKSKDTASVNALPMEQKQPAKVDGQAIAKMIDIAFHTDTARHAGINGVVFTIHNRSEHKLNTVALNIFYDNNDGQTVAKETIYFNNVHAGGIASEHAPSNEHASTLHYKLALINTDEITYHPKGQ
jgi:hypothetical protein